MVYILLCEGFEEIEALTPLDLFRRAKIDVKLIGATGLKVTGSHGITVLCDGVLTDIGEDIDLLLLPGGMPGTKNLDALPEMDQLLKNTLSCGGRIAAICAAPLVLGRRGYLQNRYAVCYPGFESELKGRKECNKRVVTDGPITTSIGMGSAIEFSGELITYLRDKQTADSILSGIQFQ